LITYRIKDTEFPIENQFPFTSDSKKWVPLKKNWEPWPPETKQKPTMPLHPTAAPLGG
jgi:hypothetical protein